jgi:hypothetical protein
MHTCMSWLHRWQHIGHADLAPQGSGECLPSPLHQVTGLAGSPTGAGTTGPGMGLSPATAARRWAWRAE